MTARSEVARIDGRSFAAAQSLTLAIKTYWTQHMYPEVRREYERRAARLDASHAEPRDIETLMADSPLYQTFAWLERHLQRFKYSGRYGLQPWHAQDREALVAALHEVADADAHLELDPELALPAYYTRVDIHQHPGGVWSDPIAGYVYERGARTTTPLAGSRHKDLHDRLTDVVADLCPAPGHILDMGCGFGKSTRPFYENFPSARIEAIDLAEPCLRYAAAVAARAGVRNARFRQMNAAETDYDAGAFDLVTSTMLLHEMPPSEVERVLAEAHRVLKPGGRIVHLDFLPQVQPGADAFSSFIHFGHGRRNNEPYMEPLAKMDLQGALAQLGFRNVAILPFEEAEGTLSPEYRNWRFPWTVIIAERGD